MQPNSNLSEAFMANEQKNTRSVTSATEGIAVTKLDGQQENDLNSKKLQRQSTHQAMKLADVIQKQQAASESSENHCKINDWRAGVQLRFVVTSSSRSMIQLIKYDQVLDTKSIACSLSRLAHNYEA